MTRYQTRILFVYLFVRCIELYIQFDNAMSTPPNGVRLKRRTMPATINGSANGKTTIHSDLTLDVCMLSCHGRLKLNEIICQFFINYRLDASSGVVGTKVAQMLCVVI